MKNSYPLDKLILLLKNLHQLIHLKLNSQNSNNYLMDQFKMFHTPTLSRYISITSNQNSTLNTSTQDDTSTISNQDITSNTSDQDANSTPSDTSDQDTDPITQLTNQFVHDLRLNNSMSNLTNSNRRFNRLDHMRFTRLISTSSNQNNLPNYDNSFKEFSQILPHSLKILEINFDIPERYLKILLQEPQLNFQCIKLYRQHYMEQLFEIFIDYQKRRKCFLELGLGRCGGIYFENHIKVAKKHFKVSTNINIDDLFYDVPIKNSPWSQKRYTEY
ncbi:hypothetical protein C1645_763156 [Glomus cerebriforme]|uniref:Uncharacterized protein n=1 Tax=Glomus cerebriforme TaxID=658196 RepID=A0A397TA66_9GLOM|nr:hypothetical protein C1645_763156 [Glomus cerebriforme]